MPRKEEDELQAAEVVAKLFDKGAQPFGYLHVFQVKTPAE
jgi:hypothetical protein